MHFLKCLELSGPPYSPNRDFQLKLELIITKNVHQFPSLHRSFIQPYMPAFYFTFSSIFSLLFVLPPFLFLSLSFSFRGSWLNDTHNRHIASIFCPDLCPPGREEGQLNLITLFLPLSASRCHFRIQGVRFWKLSTDTSEDDGLVFKWGWRKSTFMENNFISLLRHGQSYWTAKTSVIFKHSIQLVVWMTPKLTVLEVWNLLFCSHFYKKWLQFQVVIVNSNFSITQPSVNIVLNSHPCMYVFIRACAHIRPFPIISLFLPRSARLAGETIRE